MKRIFAVLACVAILHTGLAQPAKGYALLVGLSSIDDQAYQSKWQRSYGKEGVQGVDRDLVNMSAMLEGYAISVLKNKEATNTAVLRKIREIGKGMKEGDTFLLYFSGHGDAIPDKNGDEPDGMDEVLLTYNDYLVDDSLQRLLTTYFKKTTNIMIVDACHSSSSYKYYKGSMHDFEKRSSKGKAQYANETLILSKDKEKGACAYEQTKEADEPYPLIYFGATGDDATAAGDSWGGLLTKTMSWLFEDYNKHGLWEETTYQSFACDISSYLRFQTLQYHEIGPLPDKIKKQIPFKIINP